MRKKILIAYVLLITSCTASYDIVGDYFCNQKGKQISLSLDSNNFCVVKTKYMRVKVIDTLKWENNDGILYFSDIDTNYINLGDTIALITLPEKALFSKSHILFFQDSSFFVFYNTAIDTGYQSEDFYFVRKQITGEEEQIIKKNFGKTNKILIKLND
jgi:hypothetical protein